ncbi:LysR substrate-binding domain-containing protein [Serratia ureilytica]
MVQGYSLDLEFQLQKGALDVVFSDGPIEHPQMQSRRAFQERLVFIGGACRPALLAKSDLYVYSRQCHYRHLVDACCRSSKSSRRAVGGGMLRRDICLRNSGIRLCVCARKRRGSERLHT